MTCRFCKSDAVHSCCWPDEHFVLAEYQSLKIGDRVRRAIDRTGRPAAVVEFLQRIPNGFVGVALRIRNKLKSIQVCLDSPVQVERREPCGNAVCEQHLREVGEKTFYCVEHWKSWESVSTTSDLEIDKPSSAVASRLRSERVVRTKRMAVGA